MDFSLKLFKFYDLGGPITRDEIINKLDNMKLQSRKIRQYKLDSEKLDPEYVNYPEPISFQIKEKIDQVEEVFNIESKIFTYGALSFKIEKKLDVGSIDELCRIEAYEKMAREIENYFDRLYEDFFEIFAGDLKKEYRSKNYFTNLYPVYCISDTNYKNVKKLINNNKKEITALLSGVYDKRNFSKLQINNVLKDYIQFYTEDYSIIHWNGVLAIDNKADYEDLLYIVELANIQFVKLRSYDDYIDNYLSDYLQLTRKKYSKKSKIFMPKATNMISDIAQMRVEIEQITDMMDNFEKFFGKWYLAKIYYLASDIFEIKRWKKLIASRLDTVDDLYTMLHEEKNRKRMLFLNFLTLLLFILWFIIA